MCLDDGQPLWLGMIALALLFLLLEMVLLKRKSASGPKSGPPIDPVFHLHPNPRPCPEYRAARLIQPEHPSTVNRR